MVFLATAGDDFYRWAMRQAIAGTIDRVVRVDGAFSFDIGLEPALIVTDVWIENAPWASKKELARAPAYAATRRKLAAELESHLRKTGDPRVLGRGDAFDKYTYFGPDRSKNAFFEKMRKELGPAEPSP